MRKQDSGYWPHFECRLTALLAILWITAVVYGVPGNWTWIKGKGYGEIAQPYYGERGVSGKFNIPSRRYLPAYTQDSANSMWVFGGSETEVNTYRNDLWQYSQTSNTWTWHSGSQVTDDAGSYVSYGTGSDVGRPRARHGASCWVDSTGKFWLFGGRYINTTGTDYFYLNDLWSYNPLTSQWTWERGSQYADQTGSYGSLDVEAPGNMPGARHGASAWYDGQYYAYIFGGARKIPTGQTGGIPAVYNDVWRLDLRSKNWTWIKGDTSSSSYPMANMGTITETSPSSTPGGRYGMAAWKINDNSLWIFGGMGRAGNSGWGHLNDTWQFNIASRTWTWERGESYQNPGATGDSPPGTCYGVVAESLIENTVYLYGGSTPNPSSAALYSFGKTPKTWVFRRSFPLKSYFPENAVINNPNMGVIPGVSTGGAGCCDSDGYFKLFGGITEGKTDYKIYRLSVPTGITWSWIHGYPESKSDPVRGTFNLFDTANHPGGRAGAAYTGQGIFGGRSDDIYIKADTWVYDIASNRWKWSLGADYDDSHTEVNKSISVYPGARADAASWTLPNGSTYMFGGFGIGVTTYKRELNDMWIYDGSGWKHTGYEYEGFPYGDYGDRGVASVLNRPGARQGAATWIDTDGNLWMFGGKGFDGTTFGGSRSLNDLWKYDIPSKKWTWVRGSKDSANAGGSYGIEGVEVETNDPPGRIKPYTWNDNDGNFWLYGGMDQTESGIENYFNDLWKYNINSKRWTWINGSKKPNIKRNVNLNGGDSGMIDHPGARANGAAWYSDYGKAYIFGGKSAQNQFGIFEESDWVHNDLWEYDAFKNIWKCLKGYPIYLPGGNVAFQGESNSMVVPPALYGVSAWQDGGKNFYFYGGYGQGAGTSGYFSDLWKFEPPLPAASIDDWQLF